MTQQESYLIDAESKVRELDDEHFIQLVTPEVEERNNAMSNAATRKNATRVANFLTTLLEFDAA